MKTVLTLAVVLAAANWGFAAEGRVAAGTLAEMGLDGMVEMTDSDGQAIRGQGSFNFTYANTVSATAVPGAFNITQGTAINPNVSGAGNNSFSAGAYNVYLLPPLSSQAGARGFAFAAR